jgi:3-phytase
MVAVLLFAGLLSQVDVKPLRETATEAQQTDDPAVWVHPKDRSQSLIFGTVKMAAPDGAIAVYKLDGSRLMSIPNVDRPNNIDVAYGLKLGRRKVDIAVATERNKNQLRVFEILPGQGIKDLASIPVFAQPMGIALYKRKRDGAIFAIVSRKTGPSGSYLHQYELKDDGKGALVGVKVREFGQFSGTKEIEAIAVDARREEIYYSDEGAGIRKYKADPNANQELAHFAQSGWQGDREGLAVAGDYLIATDQQPGNSVFHVFHTRTLKEVGAFRLGSDTTDGIDVSPPSTSLSP